MQEMPRPRFPYLHRDRSRHGQVRWYVRRSGGPKIRIHGEYGSQAFMEAYYAAVAGREPPKIKRPSLNTFGWLVERYLDSARFAELKPSTQGVRRNILAKAVATGGKLPISALTSAVVQDGVDRKAQTPFAAQNYFKTLSAMFSWACMAGFMEDNPCRKLERPNKRTDGHHTWTDGEVEQFCSRHPVGTKARLAFDLLFYTGLRRGDVVKFGRQHLRDGMFCVMTEKSGEMVPSWIPIHPDLAASIDAGPTGDLTFLITEYGKPHTAKGFGTWFRKQCDRAGLPTRCTAHGLRKARAKILAEGGATSFQLMSRFGWTNVKQAETYTKKADRRRYAEQSAKFELSHHPKQVGTKTAKD